MFTPVTRRQDMGQEFVAFAALCTLLEDSSFAKEALNIPDIGGLTPLGLALKKHKERITDGQFRIHNGRRDISIDAYYRDYRCAISLILKSPHLSLTNMFEESTTPAHVSKKLRLIRTTTISTIIRTATLPITKISPELRALRDYSELEDPPFLGRLLEDGSGGVSSEAKAVTLILCIGKEHKGLGYAEWFFRPARFPKQPGAVVRKLLQQQAGACIMAIGELQRQLQNRAEELKKDQHEVKCKASLGGKKESKQQKRQFAKAMKENHQIWDVLNSEMPEFFLGGIYSCLVRKHNMKADIWDHILEFAGWKMRL